MCNEDGIIMGFWQGGAMGLQESMEALVAVQLRHTLLGHPVSPKGLSGSGFRVRVRVQGQGQGSGSGVVEEHSCSFSTICPVCPYTQGPRIVISDWMRGHARLLKAAFDNLGTGLHPGDEGLKEDHFHWQQRFHDSFSPNHSMFALAAGALSKAIFVPDESDVRLWQSSPDWQVMQWCNGQIRGDGDPAAQVCLFTFQSSSLLALLCLCSLSGDARLLLVQAGAIPHDRVRWYVPEPAELKRRFQAWVAQHKDLMDPNTNTLLFTGETAKLVETSLLDIDSWRLSGARTRNVWCSASQASNF
jgi:hypothetical protein